MVRVTTERRAHYTESATCLKFVDRFRFLYDIAWLHFWLPWFPARASVDPREEARRHYEATGLAVPGFEARLRCYTAHIGIDGMAYSAFLGDWVEFEQKAERALRLVSEG